jgi:hypothetical protein
MGRLILAFVLAASTVSQAAPLALRDLPSPVVRWRWAGSIQSFKSKGDRVVVATTKEVAMLDRASGRELWKRVVSEKGLFDPHLAISSNEILVGSGNEVVILDTETGAVRTRVPLSGYVREVTDDRVVVTGGEHRGELLRLDAAGDVARRVPIDADIYNLQVESNGDIVMTTSTANPMQRSVRAFDARSLEMRWEHVGALDSLELERRDGRLWIEENGVRPIDPQSGNLGDALPTKEEAALWNSELPWDLDIVSYAEDYSRTTIRRNDPKKSGSLWVINLACFPANPLLMDETLFVSCGTRSGRDRFLYLDWHTGVTRREQYGFADVRQVERAGDLLLVGTKSALIAISATESGPPENGSIPIEAEVHRILSVTKEDEAAFGRGDEIARRVGELRALGVRALPLLVKEIPTIGPASLVAAAEVLGEARYRPAAAAIARRLAMSLDEPRAGWARWNAQYVLIGALGKLGDASHRGLVASIMRDTARSGEVRQKAFTVLVALGGSDDARAFLSDARKRKEKIWSPPTVDEFAALIGKKPDAAALEDASLTRIVPYFLASHAVLVKDGDTRFVVFANSYLGSNDDLWLAQLDSADRQVNSSIFLGTMKSLRKAHYPMPGIDDDAPVPFAASIVDGVVTVWMTKGGSERLRVRIDDATRDQDRDGITDLVEERLQTDATKRDTDGDGIDDAHDPLSFAATKATTEAQQVAEAAFNQFFVFLGTTEPAMVVHDEVLDWWGRTGATIPVRSSEVDRYVQELGENGIAYIYMTPATGERSILRAAEVPLAPNERRLDLTIHRGPLSALFYSITMRQVEGEWLMVDATLTGIS